MRNSALDEIALTEWAQRPADVEMVQRHSLTTCHDAPETFAGKVAVCQHAAADCITWSAPQGVVTRHESDPGFDGRKLPCQVRGDWERRVHNGAVPPRFIVGLQLGLVEQSSVCSASPNLLELSDRLGQSAQTKQSNEPLNSIQGRCQFRFANRNTVPMYAASEAAVGRCSADDIHHVMPGVIPRQAAAAQQPLEAKPP